MRYRGRYGSDVCIPITMPHDQWLDICEHVTDELRAQGITGAALDEAIEAALVKILTLMQSDDEHATPTLH